MEMIKHHYSQALLLAREKILASGLADLVEELYVYGSVARGNMTWDSDIDLLLVLNPVFRDSRTIKKEIIFLKGSISGDTLDDPEIDLKVVFGQHWKNSSQTYYRNILREGRQIWKKT